MLLAVCFLQHVYHGLPLSGLSVVKSQLVAIIDTAAHQFGHVLQRLVTAGKQVFLHHAAIIERINSVRIFDPSQSLFTTSQLPQDSGLQGTSLMVTAVED